MTDRAEKEARHRLRECLDRTRTHIRAGDWRGPAVEAVAFVGMAADLHGTVCECCARRPTAPSGGDTDPPTRGDDA
jgi:hypothetical protein